MWRAHAPHKFAVVGGVKSVRGGGGEPSRGPGGGPCSPRPGACRRGARNTRVHARAHASTCARVGARARSVGSCACARVRTGIIRVFIRVAGVVHPSHRSLTGLSMRVISNIIHINLPRCSLRRRRRPAPSAGAEFAQRQVCLAARRRRRRGFLCVQVMRRRCVLQYLGKALVNRPTHKSEETAASGRTPIAPRPA